MKAKDESKAGSFDWTIVKEALRRAIPSGLNVSGSAGRSEGKHDLEISVLINDVFGGEIVKTHTRRGWHFYNRINGERIDLAAKEEISPCIDSDHGTYSAVMAETSANFEQNDYTILFQRFVTAFEDSFGLGKYQTA